MLPNFLCIGTQRAATTWLFNCFKEHPEIFVPEIKEVNFFSTYYDKGLSYYSLFFEGAEGYKAIGEISPTYLYSENCPHRIAELFPDIKMIVILRNPVERAFSAYQFFVKPMSKCSFEAAINRKPGILRVGHYYDQLRRYFCFFSREQFFILLYEDLVADNLKTIKSVYEFLEVDYDFIPSYVGKTINTVIFPQLQSTLQKLHIESIIGLVKKTPLADFIRHFVKEKKQKSKAAINHRTRLMLIEYFKNSNKKLEQLIGRDLSSWYQ